MADDIDDLLDEVESKFCGSEKKQRNNKNSKAQAKPKINEKSSTSGSLGWVLVLTSAGMATFKHIDFSRIRLFVKKCKFASESLSFWVIDLLYLFRHVSFNFQEGLDQFV